MHGNDDAGVAITRVGAIDETMPVLIVPGSCKASSVVRVTTPPLRARFQALSTPPVLIAGFFRVSFFADSRKLQKTNAMLGLTNGIQLTHRAAEWLLNGTRKRQQRNGRSLRTR